MMKIARQMKLTRTSKKYGISARVLLGGELVVSAGYAVSENEIRDFLMSHKRWIAKHIKAQEDKAQYKDKYSSLDVTLLHGKDVPIVYTDEGVSHYDGERVHIRPVGDKRTALETWYKAYASDYLRRMYHEVAGDIVPLRLKSVKTYYGICYNRRDMSYICLNLALVHADDECIRYVINHEITHLTVPNHSERFYRELAKREPRYVELRARLKRTVLVTE